MHYLANMNTKQKMLMNFKVTQNIGESTLLVVKI